ncbi:MAG: hypothetical protein SPJ98_10305, partial [Sodaliphilus sp.]|nr:hypothetical protein [Sodaliphilus sp.]
KTPNYNFFSWKVFYQSPDFAWLVRDSSRPRQMIDIQYGITIMGGREVSRPYQVWFLCFCFCAPEFIH